MIALRNGRVYDPANQINGEIRTLWIEGGKIVAEPAEPATATSIDLSGRIIMPGGVDMHCHIAGPAVNRARRLLAGDVQSRQLVPDPSADSPPAWPLTGSTRQTGNRYALLGYTTAIEAAVAPVGARQAHAELHDTPVVDRGLLLLLAENPLVLAALGARDRALAVEMVGSLLSRCAAWGIKAVNPGGTAHWQSSGPDPRRLDEAISGTRLTPRAILAGLCDAAEAWRLPHPLHIHANQLGVPGNIEVTLATSRALAGRRHHLTHAQFHAYGRDGEGQLASGSARLIDHLRQSPGMTLDVGQVMFGEALTLSADRDFEHYLWQITGRPYVDVETDLATGCGIVPLEYRRDRALHSLQWAIGLELFLLCDDPWQIALSTDHPNGGSFMAYPTLMAQLADRSLRDAALELTAPTTRERTLLAELDREYSLQDLCIVSRAAPARMLGLKSKGHLGVGADADVTIYNDTADREQMFRRPYLVIKGGEVIVRDGELCAQPAGSTWHVAPQVDRGATAQIDAWMCEHSTLPAEQLSPLPQDLAGGHTATLAQGPT
ncbi:MAG: formylmethanofuran dehydrogenase subunit A [Pirellulales bacterium]|nr:formylmethanofuran dehydrogenase subunit A [Pirellulales bacterium]